MSAIRPNLDDRRSTRAERIAQLLERRRTSVLESVELRNLAELKAQGGRDVLLEGVRPSATVNEVVAMAMSELRLPPNVDWNLRDDATSRLLPEQQPIGDIAQQASPHVKVTMQPDAGLG